MIFEWTIPLNFVKFPHVSLTFPHALQWWRLLVKENLDPHFMHAGAWESGTHWGAVVPRELQRCMGKAPSEPFLPPHTSDASIPPLFLQSSVGSVLPVWWVSSTGEDGSPSTASSGSCSFSARSFSSMTESSFRPGLSLRSSSSDSLESLRVEYPKRLSPHTDRVAVTACLIVSVEGAQSERVSDHSPPWALFYPQTITTWPTQCPAKKLVRYIHFQ